MTYEGNIKSLYLYIKYKTRYWVFNTYLESKILVSISFMKMFGMKNIILKLQI